jgi:hypothetical protein
MNLSPEELVYLGSVGVLTGQLQKVVGPGRGASLGHLQIIHTVLASFRKL